MTILRTAIAALALAGIATAAHAEGDAVAGAKVFKKCMACHTLDGGKKMGPTLQGVMDRPVASVEGFKYSKAMAADGEAGNVWDAEHLTAYLSNPRGSMPGNRMAFAGLKKPQEIEDLLAYLAEH